MKVIDKSSDKYKRKGGVTAKLWKKKKTLKWQTQVLYTRNVLMVLYNYVNYLITADHYVIPVKQNPIF